MVEQRQIETPLGPVHITESGQGDPLLLVHGLFTSAVVFDQFMKRLPPGVRAIAVDLPGSGRSEPRADFVPSWSSYARAVVQTAAAIGLERFDLLGHSMGGGISVLVAANHQEMVRRLVLVDAVTLPYRVPLKGRLPLIPLVGELLFRAYGRKMFIDYFSGDVFYDPKKLDLEKTKDLYRLFDKARPLALAALRATADPLPVSMALSQVSCPTLVLWGGRDTLVPLSVGQALERAIGDAVLKILDSCGHSPLEECPDPAAEAIFSFLLSGDQ